MNRRARRAQPAAVVVEAETRARARTAGMMGAGLVCSFCGKSGHTHIVPGPCVYICEECLEVACFALAEHKMGGAG